MRQRVAVWGTGNLGRIALRSVAGFPGLDLGGVITSTEAKVGLDAADLAGDEGRQALGSTGVVATSIAEADAVLASCDAVAYTASGDVRPDDATADIERCLRAGCTVVTPSLYSMYDPTSAPDELRTRLLSACADGSSRLFVSGVDPGWANDALAVVAAGLCTRIEQIRCQEIFDYSTYDQEYAVRELIGFGKPMSEVPMMLLPSVPTMVWGGNLRLIGRGLGVELDDITEVVERRPLDSDIETALGRFEAGTQGAFRLEVIGWFGGRPRIVVDHVTRIHPSCAPDWPQPDEGVGDHRVIVDGDPRLSIVMRADGVGPAGTRADGGNATAVGRLLGAIGWLADTEPGLYDGLDVPMYRPTPAAVAAERWAD